MKSLILVVSFSFPFHLEQSSFLLPPMTLDSFEETSMVNAYILDLPECFLIEFFIFGSFL